MITHTMNLDVVPYGTSPQVRLSGYDVDFKLIINLFASRGHFIIEPDTTIFVRGVKLNGDPLEQQVTFDANGTVTIPGQVFGVDRYGSGVFELCLVHGGKELYTSNFYILVEPSPAERM